MRIAVAAFAAQTQAQTPRFNILAVGETQEIHGPYVAAAKPWLAKMATDSNFTITHVENPNSFTDAVLEKYDLILQLNYTPWRWSATAKTAFEKYIDQGKGGWIGIHHALLFGPVVQPQGEPLWNWFYTFMGSINYRNYIASFAEANVRVEAPEHPVFRGVPASFVVTKDEWYTWDRSPRANVRVLANVDENSYKPASNIKMGDHPVVWTNEKYKGRNLFLFMGHHPDHFKNEAYVTLLRNAIFWAAGATTPTGISETRYGSFVAGRKFVNDGKSITVSGRNLAGRRTP